MTAWVRGGLPTGWPGSNVYVLCANYLCAFPGPKDDTDTSLMMSIRRVESTPDPDTF